MPAINGVSKKTPEWVINERRQKVAEMYLRGVTQHEIGKAVGVTQACISLDLQAIKDLWQASAIVAFDDKMAIELAKIDHIEIEAWKAWARSQEDNVTEHSEEVQELRDAAEDNVVEEDVPARRQKRKCGEPTMVPVKIISKTLRRGQVGNDSFLQRVAWCVEMRLRLMGALKNEKGGAVTVVNINWDNLLSRPEEPNVVESALEKRLAELPPSPAGGPSGPA